MKLNYMTLSVFFQPRDLYLSVFSRCFLFVGRKLIFELTLEIINESLRLTDSYYRRKIENVRFLKSYIIQLRNFLSHKILPRQRVGCRGYFIVSDFCEA